MNIFSLSVFLTLYSPVANALVSSGYSITRIPSGTVAPCAPSNLYNPERDQVDNKLYQPAIRVWKWCVCSNIWQLMAINWCFLQKVRKRKSFLLLFNKNKINIILQNMMDLWKACSWVSLIHMLLQDWRVLCPLHSPDWRA